MLFKKINNIPLTTIDGIIYLHSGDSFIDKLIQFVNKSPFSHVSCSLEHTFNECNIFKRLGFHIESLPGTGVIVNSIQNNINTSTNLLNLIDRISNLRGKRDITGVLIPHNTTNEDEEKHRNTFNAIIDKYKNNIPYEQNILQFAKFILPKRIRRFFNIKETKNSFFCSEFVLDILEEDTVKRLNKKTSDFCPGDFFRPLGNINEFADDTMYNDIIVPKYNPLVLVIHSDFNTHLYKYIGYKRLQ